MHIADHKYLHRKCQSSESAIYIITVRVSADDDDDFSDVAHSHLETHAPSELGEEGEKQRQERLPSVPPDNTKKLYRRQ